MADVVRNQLKEAMKALPEAAQRVGAWLGHGESAKQMQEVAQSPEIIERSVGWILSGAGHLTVIIFLIYFLLISREHGVVDRRGFSD